MDINRYRMGNLKGTNMKKIVLLFSALLLLSSFGFSQTKKSTIRTDADVMLRLLHNQRVPGMVWIGMQVGADLAYIKSDGKYIDLVATVVMVNGVPLQDLYSNRDILNTELLVDQQLIPVGFTLLETTVIFCNGIKLDPDQWSGIGTTNLSLLITILKYDHLTILN